ncbi:hypothetical protein [Kribbella kalugense]|uniref:D-mannose binding lectin n=1 Tax=Kribbella kalugense TaxID=2512221 RepID=A0A4R8A170_9ACTN|nr:hypothetical protein [Kribbella kalugense]TDW24243.1 D-mannose binding lectin [Kribbella kalugense]
MISIKSATTRILAAVAGVAAGATLLVPVAAQAAGAATTTTAHTTAQSQAAAVSDFLAPGQYLKPGQYRRSKNGVYALLMQTDGNAVLYKGKSAVWSTVTHRKASSLIMQRDGNLVVISGRTVVWASGTSGSTNSTLLVQNDSNLVLYNTRKKAVWTRSMVMVTLGSGRALSANTMVVSHSRVYRLQMQSDGNLVLLKSGKAIWSTGTKSGAYAVMQLDGNFVLYSGKKVALWGTKTTRKGSVLQLQDTGNFVIIYGRTIVWSSHTAGR